MACSSINKQRYYFSGGYTKLLQNASIIPILFAEKVFSASVFSRNYNNNRILAHAKKFAFFVKTSDKTLFLAS